MATERNFYQTEILEFQGYEDQYIIYLWHRNTVLYAHTSLSKEHLPSPSGSNSELNGVQSEKSKLYDTWMNKLKITSSDCDAHSIILKVINIFYLQKNLFST
jgi:hypothetical protein